MSNITRTIPSERIGLFGGSFDPFHLAHQQLIKTAYRELELTRIIVIPCGEPYQKQGLQATASERLEMARLTCHELSYVTVSDIEIRRPGATYTIDTLSELCLPEHRYFWLLGADQLTNFCTWKQWQDILKKVVLAVVKRPNYAITPPLELAHWLAASDEKLHYLTMPESTISATKIRQACRHNRSLSNLVHPDVEHYIYSQHIYS